MTPATRQLALGFGSAVLTAAAALSGPALAAGLLATALGGFAVLGNTVLGAYLLVALAQLDGIALLVDQRLPISLFKAVTALVLLSLVLTVRRHPLMQGRLRLSPTAMFTLLFAIWLCVSYLASDWQSYSYDHTKGFLQTLLLVPILGLTVTSPRHLRRMVLVIAASGAISAVFVILETVFGLRLLPYADEGDVAAWLGAVRSAGASAYNPTTSSHLMAVSLMLALVMALYDWRGRRLWVLISLLCLVALPMMGARSGAIAVAMGIGLIGFRMRHHRLFPVVALGALAALVVAVLNAPDTLVERFGVLGDFLGEGDTSDRSLLRRLSYNQIGLALWAEHPVTGLGPGAYPVNYASDAFRWYPGREAEARQLHNAYLEVAVETGIVGIALFLGALLSAAWAALKAGLHPVTETQVLAQALGVAMAVFMFASLFMPNEDIKYTWILAALCARAAQLAGGWRVDTGQAG
ncbi:O-antigen ligase family protein [Ruegeria pomeroyi]|nr:O-antigen ligase family protein [Ruegeria pomeroyi]MCE8531030.1 O-antigen ligase family protein [Ruegeria pomeroyi]